MSNQFWVNDEGVPFVNETVQGITDDLQNQIDALSGIISYEETDIVGEFTNGTDTWQTLTVRVAKINDVIHVYLPVLNLILQTITVATPSYVFNQNLPVGLRPPEDVQLLIRGTDGVPVLAYVEIDTNGCITVYRDIDKTTNWSTLAIGWLTSYTCTYII